MIWCDWPWRKLVICCDGTVVCGCADPMMIRRLGNIQQQSLKEIWRAEPITRIREGLVTGKPLKWCQDCELHYQVEALPDAALLNSISDEPCELFIEPTIHCPISCANTTCSRESGIHATRNLSILPFDTFQRMIHSLKNPLQRVQLYNYGEPLLHPQFADMARYIKAHSPNAWVASSTNGVPLTTQTLRESIIQSGLDELLFSIDGVDQYTYSRYRRGGDFVKVFTNLQQFLQDRQRLHAGKPYTIWRYILFNWNDSDEQIAKAQELARSIGVDRFCFELTDYPADSISHRVAPGTEKYEQLKHLIWGKARYSLSSSIRLMKFQRIARKNSALAFTAKLTNTSPLRWEAMTPYGIRFVTLGVSLLDRNGKLLNQDWSHIPLPQALDPGQTLSLSGHIKTPAHAGLYRLRFDMVYEGVAWFSDLGDKRKPALTKQILVI